MNIRTLLSTILLTCLCLTSFGQVEPAATCRLLPNNQKIVLSRTVTLSQDTDEHWNNYDNTVNAPLFLRLMYESSVYEDNTLSGYSLVLLVGIGRHEYTIPKGARLLLKTVSEEIITLTEIAEDEIAFPSMTSESPLVLKNRYDGLAKTYWGKYHLSEEQLNKILEGGIIKIRLETSGTYHEWSFKKKESMKRGDSVFATEYNRVSFLTKLVYDDLQWSIDPKSHLFDKYTPWRQYTNSAGRRTFKIE